jgi:ubiquinone/menaquinone biosynthesis C-methylase UbiE
VTDVTSSSRARVATSFDARAATYDQSAMHRELAAAVVRFCDLRGVRTVLDVATGTGLVPRALAAARAGADDGLRVVGVDLSPGMLAVARRELAGIGVDATLLEADAAALPLPDACVDLVTCITALHLIPDHDVAIAEWARVLRPGGRAVTATFAGFARPGPSRPYRMDHEPFRTPEALADTAARSGMRLLRHETWDHDNGDMLLLGELEAAG